MHGKVAIAVSVLTETPGVVKTADVMSPPGKGSSSKSCVEIVLLRFGLCISISSGSSANFHRLLRRLQLCDERNIGDLTDGYVDFREVGFQPGRCRGNFVASRPEESEVKLPLPIRFSGTNASRCIVRQEYGRIGNSGIRLILHNARGIPGRGGLSQGRTPRKERNEDKNKNCCKAGLPLGACHGWDKSANGTPIVGRVNYF